MNGGRGIVAVTVRSQSRSRPAQFQTGTADGEAIWPRLRLLCFLIQCTCNLARREAVPETASLDDQSLSTTSTLFDVAAIPTRQWGMAAFVHAETETTLG